MIPIRIAVSLALLAGPLAASAAPRIVVARVRGDAGGALSRQISAALCARFECVPRSMAYAGTRPDFAKARRNGVSGIVFGSLTGREPNRLVWLALLTTSLEPSRTWSLPVGGNGRLSRRSLDGLTADVERRIAPRPVAPAPPPAPARPPQAAPPPPLPPPPPPEAPPARPPEAAAPRPAPPERAAPPAPRPGPAPAEEPRRPAPRWLALEVGVHVANRKLDYSGTSPAGSATLQRMSVDAIFSPRARVEVFPAAALAPGALAGLGAFGEYRHSVGFKVKSAGDTRSASLARLGAGVTWRLPPLTSLRLGLSPAVSYERLDATVGEGGIAGLPDAHLRGVKVGSGLSIPIGPRVVLLLGGGYVFWTSAGDLVKGSVPFFPSGSASAIEAEAGVAVPLTRALSLQVLGEYSGTSYSLDRDPTDTYRASGATDRYVGGRAFLRAEL